ncbi:phosphate ABC transporter substrate-binding protein [Mycoplasma cottewii]|uniref:Phosphate ABC transporter substrate-binding protein n=1 Tax=Mycoplasma cottewii TaxID=51364 RepID=A0ABY5TVU8_9MOLU|nr:phosphate ABC transporter substrate-binding protein [Mycoplasma cottewii]UWD34788.1 phosphate ABC transporter substrate-binding protein [Mycoplasma cottewii]
MKQNQTTSKIKRWCINFKEIIVNKRLLLIFILIIASICGLWVWTFSKSNNTISIGGSASADPIMQQLTNKYRQKTGQSFIYSSTGSGAGARNVINETYSIGFISKSETDNSIPEEIRNNLVRKDNNGDGILFRQIEEGKVKKEETFKQIMSEKKTQDGKSQSYHFVDFAKDSIVFVYNIKGTGLTEKESKDIAFNLGEKGTVDKKASQALEKVYSVNDQTKLVSWSEFYEAITGKQVNNISKNVKVTPYSTNSGSGTRSSFEHISGFKNNKTKIGTAVNQYNSNGAIFTQLDKSDGAFGFVSMEYAQQIKNHKNLRAVIIKGNNKKWDINEDSENYQDYPLNRPFIALYKMTDNDNKNRQILEFMQWVSSSNEVSSSYQHLGLVQRWKRNDNSNQNNSLINENKNHIDLLKKLV